MLNTTPINFKGCESAGSIAKKNNLATKNADKISFRGGESAGSIAKICDPNCPECDTLSFKAHPQDVAKKSGFGFGTCLITLAGIIGGLGLLHKKGVTSKMGENKFSEFFKGISEKCYDLCHTVKSKVMGLFSKKS